MSQVMEQQPYLSAERVFWIMDNGSSHRGERSVKRLKEKWENLIPVHLPLHASWLNQIEIYFSIVQRKVLTPNDFASLPEVEERLLGFQERYQEMAEPFGGASPVRTWTASWAGSPMKTVLCAGSPERMSG